MVTFKLLFNENEFMTVFIIKWKFKVETLFIFLHSLMSWLHETFHHYTESTLALYEYK
jgi:hypothetical protein